MAAHPPSAAAAPAAAEDGSASLPGAPGGHRGGSPDTVRGGPPGGIPPTPFAGGASNTPARKFQFPWTPIAGFPGPSLVGFETPPMAFVVDAVTVRTFFKHCTWACTWWRPSFCPDYMAYTKER